MKKILFVISLILSLLIVNCGTSSSYENVYYNEI